MATCGYSELVGGPCGCSSSNPANAVCETIERCGRNIKSHLKFFDCFDSTLQTEADLLLARAGKMSIQFLTNCVEVMQGINNEISRCFSSGDAHTCHWTLLILASKKKRPQDEDYSLIACK